MSTSNWFLKPPVLVTVVVVIALMGLSAGLQKKSDSSDKVTVAEQDDFDRLETGRTEINAVSATSRVSTKGQKTAERAPAKKQEPRKQVVEDFEMARRRAEGNSTLTGRVFGSTRESSGDRRGWGGPPPGEGFFGGFSGFRGPGENNDRADNRGPGERSDRRSSDRETSRSDERRREWAGRRDFNSTSSQSFDFSSRFGDMKPIEKAEVLLFENDPNTTHPALRTTFTDSEGSFTIANVNGADQRYILVVKADGFAPEATFVSVHEQTREQFIRLEKGVPLRGKVIDSETSEPIPGAIVYQPNPRFESSSAMGVTTTSITGEFYFPNTHPGSNVTMARAKGYATERERVRAPDENSIIEMTPGGGSISGITIDRLTGKPQGGARVWATGRRDMAESVLSADDGSFKIENLPEGEFTVYATRGMKSEEQTIELARGDEVKDINIMLPTELLVSGQVINAKDREPLEGIKVWFQSSKGAQYRKTNASGQFAFETMAIDEYAILIHEKGFLPIQDRKSTQAEETIVRKVAKNQSSDEVTIRLRPVPSIAGNVTQQSRRGNGDQPVYNAEVKLAFEDGRDFYELKTKSDPAGNFFINLPNGGRGNGIVVASNQFSMDTQNVKVPREKPVELKLERNFMMGQLLLVDETPLDGVKVTISKALSANRGESRSANRVILSSIDTMRGGNLFGPVPSGGNVDLTFNLPDGVAVTKNFQSNRLLNSRPIFVYDPVSQDIIADTTPRERGNGSGGRGGRGRGDGQQRGDGNNNQQRQRPQQNQQQTNGQNAIPPVATQ